MEKSFYHASLFTGIGGFDLAASWMGWKNVFQCEIDPFCQKLLQHWFPESEMFSDIKTSNFNKYRGTIDIISGGFPCQPFSVAGKRKGTNDDRYLWPEMLRVLREVKPQWFVGENVCGLLTGQSGVVFERVCADLEDAGYKVQSFIIPACAVGAPHRRDRIWIVANANGVYAAGQGHEQTERTNGAPQSGWDVSDKRAVVHFGDKGIVANTNNERTGKLRNKSQTQGTHCGDELLGKQYTVPNWNNFPTQSPVCDRDDGVSGELADITFSSWRRQSIKALGNAVVPQIAYEIFKTIEKVELINNQ
jgi:DNA (cytosine-5)-methyltransferase 1